MYYGMYVYIVFETMILIINIFYNMVPNEIKKFSVNNSFLITNQYIIDCHALIIRIIRHILLLSYFH